MLCIHVLVCTCFWIVLLVTNPLLALTLMFLVVRWLQFALCLNWGPVAAITLYVIEPRRRSTAEAVSILVTHLFGDAASPYLVGVVSDLLHDKYGYNDVSGKLIGRRGKPSLAEGVSPC